MKPTVSKQQWLDWINEQEQSDLSIAAFCRNKTINADNFYYHRGQHRKNSLTASSAFVRAQLTFQLHKKCLKNRFQSTNIGYL
jgi:hypothetical protein